jgi:hypothetical protein
MGVFLAAWKNSAAQRLGVQRPATALTGPDLANTVCRQTAAKVN